MDFLLTCKYSINPFQLRTSQSLRTVWTKGYSGKWLIDFANRVPSTFSCFYIEPIIHTNHNSRTTTPTAHSNSLPESQTYLNCCKAIRIRRDGWWQFGLKHMFICQCVVTWRLYCLLSWKENIAVSKWNDTAVSVLLWLDWHFLEVTNYYILLCFYSFLQHTYKVKCCQIYVILSNTAAGR